jgi:DNA repair exonuclease SbcCD ATPase subunit
MTIMVLSGVLGFLLASLIAWFLAPLLWRRAVRVTTKRLIQQSPRMIDEGHADRDQMRAEFAVTTRKMEVKLERQKEVSDTQLIELSKMEKKRDRLQGKIESLQVTLQKHEEKIEKLNIKLERSLVDIGKKSEQLTTQSERLARQTEMLNSQATALETNAYELDARKAKIDDYANKEVEFSTIVSKQDLELSQLRSKQQQIKLSKKTEDTSHQRLVEKLNQEIRESHQQVSDLTKNLEARKTATLHLRQEVGKNKEKINDLIRQNRTKDEKIRQLHDGFSAIGKSAHLSTLNMIEAKQTPLAAVPVETVSSTLVDVNREDNDNRISPADQPATPAPVLTKITDNSYSENSTRNGLETTNRQQQIQSRSHRPAPATRPSRKKQKPMKTSDSLSLAERIRALQTDHPKSM